MVVSEGAGLYFSILLRPKITQKYWPLITFMGALAVGDALREAWACRPTSSGLMIFFQVNEKSAGYWLRQSTHRLDVPSYSDRDQPD